MFTGLVEGTAVLHRREARPGGVRLVLDLGRLADGVQDGDSIAVDGCCLTVVERDGARCAFDAVPETLDRTTLGEWVEGRRVNVERSLRLGDRLGGHLVTGHIDGRGRIVTCVQTGDQVDVSIEVPEGLRRYVVEKGSIAIDGVSLTIAALTDQGLRVAVIPHTLEVTTLGDRRAGDPINLEVDVLGKWVERLMTTGRVPTAVPFGEIGRAGGG